MTTNTSTIAMNQTLAERDTALPRGSRWVDRLRRKREINDSSQQRRMSRFSIISATSTAVDAPAPIGQGSGSTRPTVREVVRKHPRNVAYIGTLATLFIGGIVGWAIFLSVRPANNERRDGFRGGLLINGLFIVILIIIFLLASRQAIFIYRLFRPVPPHRSPTLPPWLVGRPPTYSEALRGRGTGDVEDNIIAQNENLPKYGETRGSTLLARSQSRGGAVGREEAERISMEELQGASGNSFANERDGSNRDVIEPEVDLRPPPSTREEAERRQIEDARRYQAAAGYSGTDEKTHYVQPVEEDQQDQPRQEERWEEVALERNITETRR